MPEAVGKLVRFRTIFKGLEQNGQKLASGFNTSFPQFGQFKQGTA